MQAWDKQINSQSTYIYVGNSLQVYILRVVNILAKYQCLKSNKMWVKCNHLLESSFIQGPRSGIWFHPKNINQLYMKYIKYLTFCETSTTPSCSGPIAAQKSRGNSVPGAVFSHKMPKMDFHYSHRFS